MAEPSQRSPGFIALLRRLARTGSGALANRAELLSLEWQEEKARLTSLLVWTAGLLFLTITGTIMLAATILLFMPQSWRPYAAAGLTLLFFAGAVFVWTAIRRLLREEPFEASIGQLKQDGVWLDSLETRS